MSLDQQANLQGRHEGSVIDNVDPEKRGRVRAMVPSLFGAEVSVWLEAATGSAVNIPPPGTAIWVHPTFSDDNSITELSYTPGAIKTAQRPSIAIGGEDETTGALKSGHPITVPSPDGRASDNWRPGEDGKRGTQPLRTAEALSPSPNASTYPEAHVIKTPGGTVLEWDDTPNAERLHIWHPSGTYYEINAAGGLSHRHTKEQCAIITERTCTVGGDDLLEVVGNKLHQTTGKDMSVCQSNYARRAKTMEFVSDKDMTKLVGGSYEEEITGDADIQYINGRSVSVGGRDTYACTGGYSGVVVGDVSLMLAAVNPVQPDAVVVNPLGAVAFNNGVTPLAFPILNSQYHFWLVANLITAFGAAATAATAGGDPGAATAFTSLAASMVAFKAIIDPAILSPRVAGLGGSLGICAALKGN